MHSLVIAAEPFPSSEDFAMRTIPTQRVPSLFGFGRPQAGPQVIRLRGPLMPTWALGALGLATLVLTSFAFA